MESGHILGIFSDRDEYLNFERTFFRSAPSGRYRLLKGCWWQNPDDVRRELLKSGLPIADLETRGDLVILDLSKTYDRFGPVGAAGAWFKEATCGYCSLKKSCSYRHQDESAAEQAK